jgi:hypothetical protein
VRGLVLGCALMTAGAVHAETRTYALAVGNNAPPVEAEGEQHLDSLRYADDDAADFYLFARDVSHRAVLLTVLDAASQRRFPDLAETARPPTMAELTRAVATLRAQFQADVRDGHDPVLLLFFSGHGTRGGKRPPSLTLLDQPLTQELLYDTILAALPARYVHLFVDACHAEEVVRPRDLEAQPVEITDQDVQTYAARATLARFPHVGAILATASGVQAHEWDVYQRGVFSHELLSGLRGAADINGDGKIEYSELSAFLGAANREVADPRARLSVVVRPPSVNRRAALVDTARLRGTFRLVGRGDWGEVSIEDELGNRVADFHAEPGHQVALALPSERALFVLHRRGEARLRGAAGAIVRLDELRFAKAGMAARGAIHSALQRGLFATAYGPRYYRGFVDRNAELTPVPIPQDAPVLHLPATRELDQARYKQERSAGIALMGVGGALAVVSVVMAALAADALAEFQAATFERPAAEARERGVSFEAAAFALAGVAVAAGAVGIGIYVRGRKYQARPAKVGWFPNALRVRW